MSTSADKLSIALQRQFEQAFALHQQKRLKEAQVAYAAILKKYPYHFDSLHLLGVIAIQNQHYQGAIDLIHKALSIHPHNAEAHYNCGLAHQELQQWTKAVACYDRAISLVPDAASYCNRGVALKELKQWDEAIASYDQAILLKPDYVDAYYNRGVALRVLNRLEEAVSSYDAAIGIQPQYADAYCGKSLVLLLKGEFETGWRLFEWRWHPSIHTHLERHFAQPRWHGTEPLAGRTLFLHSEQGLGDILQFCRYVPLAKALGARVLLALPSTLMRLFSRFNGVDSLVEFGSALPAFDLHCPLMSLPLAFKTFAAHQIPANIPYLNPPPALVETWAQRLGAKTRPRVGLVWNGGFRPNLPKAWAINERRNMPFANIAQLNRADIDFYSLQKGEQAEKALESERIQHWPGPNFHIFSQDIKDYADTAALVAHLDLVIAVDTSVVHLAGAMGKPVWLLNRFDSCWRWLLEREDSVWYPSLRIFRQPKLGDWESVITEVQLALTRWLDAPTGL